MEHNYQLLSQLDYFRIFDLPLLVGVSRKSMINRVLGTMPEDALNGTTAVNTLALLKGANILRVHDVRQAVEAVKIVEMLKSQSENP
jgi:dihydropteroate synthase